MKEIHRLRGVEKKIPKARLLVRHNLGRSISTEINRSRNKNN